MMVNISKFGLNNLFNMINVIHENMFNYEMQIVQLLTSLEYILFCWVPMFP